MQPRGFTLAPCVRRWAVMDASLMRQVFPTFKFLTSFGGVRRENSSCVE